MKGRFSGSIQCAAASEYIAKEFKEAGLLPLAGNDGYFMKVRSNWNNVMGALPGRSKKGEAIIFSAHYDHVGTTRTNPHPDFGGQAFVEDGDTIYNGANDNASGMSAVIALARYFGKNRINERTIIFVGFVGEEEQMIGSSAMAQMIDADSVIAMINIEMIGRKSEGFNSPYITGGEYSKLQQILNSNLYSKNRETYGKRFFRNDPFDGHRLFFRSDNVPFFMKRVAAHTIMVTSPEDEYYHNLNDEPWTLDYSLMSRIVKAIAIGSGGLIKGIDHPGKARRL
jgi:Zn-dependent M28 family amino/carboxypeptidase